MTLLFRVVLLRLTFDSSEGIEGHTYTRAVGGVDGVMMTLGDTIITQDVVWSGFQVSLDPWGLALFVQIIINLWYLDILSVH